MRRISTRIGVYAILLLAAIYGSTSLHSSRGETTANVVVTIQKAATSAEKKEQSATQNFQLRKMDNPDGGYLPFLQPNAAAANAELNFFTHSATIQHYISTI